MTAVDLRLHVKYSGWASRRLVDAALKLPPEQLRRDMGASHKSIQETLAHILFANTIWMSRIQGVPFQSPAGAMEVEFGKVQSQWEQWADSLTDEDLTRAASYQDMKGNPHQTPLWQIGLHVVNHATLHRGQVVTMMRQLGVTPPATDLIFFYREQE
jgi:uncharacterized damage-inducible protein DinB